MVARVTSSNWQARTYPVSEQCTSQQANLLTGNRAGKKDIVSEDVPHLLQFRREHMPALDVEARRPNDPAIEIISRYIVAQRWKCL